MFKRLSIVSCLLFITVVGFSQKLFIAENGASNIRRSNVDGTSLEIIDGNAFVSAPRSLVYDEQRNNVFWIETNGAFERIKKASLTDFGGNSRLGYASNLVSVSTTGNNFRYLVINPITRELLFSNNGSIVAISLDATGTITALPPARFSSAAFIQGFDIDVTNNKILFYCPEYQQRNTHSKLEWNWCCNYHSPKPWR
ncbi:MAG: hypothetical protein KF860_02920 [Cyclobacteriaceae bacterium]|nr:hypothetical protein [Cyclobacteriaceae bacterium]